MNNDTVTVHYDALWALTETAVRLNLGDRRVWFPFSECPELRDLTADSPAGSFECPEWLASEKDLC